MTSLAKQLQRLAIPGQPSLRQIVSKKRPSLLFDAKEAADIDIETIYALGTNGLEELISIDQSFADFETSLFEESCKEFERTIQTQDVLEHLDRMMSAFLRKLSPYFLLKPAQKCLEWLIRAFRVNSFNVDAVMECILPYYETKLFARVLQLLPIRNRSSLWHWLRPSQKAGSPLSKLTLVQHCLSNQSFLVFICEMVPRSSKSNKTSPPSALRTVVALYSSTLVSVLETGTVTEELVSRLLPYIVKGLRSSHPDYKAASYLIVGQLASKVAMEKQLCTSLLETIAKHLGLEQLSEGLSCVAVICQTQELATFSRKTLKYLRKTPSLVPTLSKLSHTHSITPLLQMLLSSLLEGHFVYLHANRVHGNGSHDSSNHDDASLKIMMEILDGIRLEDETVFTLLSRLLECYVNLCEQLGGSDEEQHQDLSSSIAPLAQSLDAKYPEMMDKALQAAVVSMATRQHCSDSEEEEEGEGGERRDGESCMRWLHEFVTLALSGSRHQVLPDLSGTLVLGVHHPNPAVRAMAVKQLGRSLRHRTQRSTPVPDVEFISSTLLGRLEDSEPSVVKATLDLGAKLLFKHLPADDLVNSLTQLLSRRRNQKSSSEWQSCVLQSLSVLTSNLLFERASHKVDDVIVASLPLLFVGRHGNKFTGSVADALAGSVLARDHPMLGRLQEVLELEVWQAGCSRSGCRDPQCLSAANDAMFRHLGGQLARLEPERMQYMVFHLLNAARSIPHDQTPYYALLSVVGVAMATVSTHPLLTQLQLSFQLLEHVQGSIGELDSAELEGPDIPRAPATLSAVYLSLVQKHPTFSHAHAHLLLWLLNTVTEHIGVPNHLQTLMWLEDSSGTREEQLYYRVLLLLFSLLTHLKLTDVAQGGGILTCGRHMLQRMVQLHFTGCGSLLRFLAMIWTAPVAVSSGLEPGQHIQPQSHSVEPDRDEESDSNAALKPPLGITAAMQARSLNIACAYFKSLDFPALIALAGTHCPVIPSLLVPLMSSYKTIRDRALNTLSTLHEAITTKVDPQEAYNSTPLLRLAHSICTSRLAISADHMYLRQLLGKLYSSDGGLELSVGQLLQVEQTPRKKRGRRKEEARVKASILEAILDSLLMHVVAMEAPSNVQSVLLSALLNVEHQAKLHGTLPLLKQLLAKLSHSPDEAMETNQQITWNLASARHFPLSEYEGMVLQWLVEGIYTPGMAPLMQINSEAFQILVQLLGTTSCTSQTTPPPQELAMLQVTPEFFAGLPSPDARQKVLQCLVNLLLESQRSTVVTMVKEQVVKLPLSADLVVSELNRHVDQLGGKDVSATPIRKRARLSKPPSTSATPLESEGIIPLPWRRVTVLLEIIQNLCHTLTDSHLLPPHLFNLLSKCLESEDLLRVALEYCQQLLLSSLLNICTHLTTQGVDNARALLVESQFNVELVVQCVRLSSSPLTHHHALLLLGTAATIFPSRVLHNVMPIFTFMGSHVLRQDDQYSFQVITKTVDTVIPALVRSGSAVFSGRPHPSLPRRPGMRATPTTVEDVVTEIIRVFVDAVPHMPGHRRLPLFSRLLATVGPPGYLHVALALLTEKQVVQTDAKDQTPKEVLLGSSFSLSLAHEFPPDVQVLAQLRLLEYVARLPHEKPETSYKLRQLPPSINSLFNVTAHTGKQLRQFKYSVHSLVVAMLSHRAFVSKVSSLDSETTAVIEATILKLLHCVLGYVGSLNKLRSVGPEDSKQRFCGDLLKKAYEVIDKVVSLLSPSSFIEVMSQLASGVGENVQRKALEILNSKLEGTRLHLTEEQDSSLLTLVDVLVGVAQGGSTPPINRQTALFSIKLLARRMASSHCDLFIKVSHAVLAIISSENLHPQVHASSLLCMAELCSVLGPHMIPLLPSLLPRVLQHVGGVEDGQVLLHISATTALSAAVQTLPKFLGTHINDIVLRVCHPDAVIATNKESVQLVNLSAEVRERVSRSVPPRTLLPAFCKCYPDVVQYSKDSMLALLSMLSSTVSLLSKEDVKTHTSLLLELFTAVLDYRVTQANEPHSVVEEVEECCLQAFTNLVVKLSEASFRPVFLKLFNWATHQSSPKERVITFYHLADRVAEKLKNLFLLFAGHIVKNAALLLKTNSDETQGTTFFQDEDWDVASEKGSLLLGYLLQCLRKCFLYDKGSFLSKERFETLLKPLVDQISNCLGGAERYIERVESHLVPCIAQFAVAAGKDSLWKPLNYQILLKSRHSDSQVRFAVLKVLQELYTRLGEAFMVLLPETIPFLAELMEDESTEVEQQTQAVIGCIENILGESIQHFF